MVWRKINHVFRMQNDGARDCNFNMMAKKGLTKNLRFKQSFYLQNEDID